MSVRTLCAFISNYPGIGAGLITGIIALLLYLPLERFVGFLLLSVQPYIPIENETTVERIQGFLSLFVLVIAGFNVFLFIEGLCG